mmetsp:Transcript_57564/g.167171  ORF Transcript_57564/g.167171 Transcript_57564/m.167171 type:complete len:931 (+) Transcript_57564:102-2894(+)
MATARRPLGLALLLRLLWCTVVAEREVLVKEVVLDSAVADIVYTGKEHECVLLTTKNKRLYFSEDSGQSWKEITGTIEKTSAVLQIERMIVNPADKTVVILQTQRMMRGTGETSSRFFPYIYISEDSGRNWRRAWGKHHGLHSWISHPTKREWALVSWWSGDCSSSAARVIDKDADSETAKEDEREPCVHRLMFTKDLGKNFLSIAEYVVQFSWGTAAHDQENRVYFSAYKKKSGDQGKLTLWTSEVDFNYVDFSMRGKPRGSVATAVPFGNKFLISNEYVLVARVKSDASQTVNLMVSSDGAKTFQAALLPSGMGELEEKWYTILDTSEGAVILHINSDSEGVKDAGRIFISDPTGTKYSQSLSNNVRASEGDCEFDKVVSMNGVYMANIVVPPANTDQGYGAAKAKLQEQVEQEAAGGDAVDQKHARSGQKGKAKATKEERTIRTVISFDKGGAWNYLKAPRVNSLGKPYECASKGPEECSLHLHGTSSWDYYAPFYSLDSAVGIIMGTGNVGSSLRFEPEETSTFLSNDGGQTWMEAHKGAFIYEFGDHGGLIVMADDLKKTSEVVFSWNEGQSWFDFKVSKTGFEVDNILTEPNSTATTFVMFGTREEGVGVLYYMKFDAMGFPACKGVWAADSVSSDYETWSPTDGASSESCLLGQKLTYTRRKRTAQCWNGEKFERPVVQKKCACTQADFACEIGFTRAVGSKECLYGGAEMMPERFIPTLCSKTFSAMAYRKVPGDVCEGGWQPTPVEVPCPSAGVPAGTLKSLLLAGLAIGVLYLGYGFFCTGTSSSKTSFEFAAPKGMMPDWSVGAILQLPLVGASWLYSKFCARNRGFDAHPTLGYQKVGRDEFDFDGIGGETSLNDFIDQAEYDDSARVYDGEAADHRPERTGIVAGSHNVASRVPKLSAPGTGGALKFDMSSDDQDLL